MTCRFCNRPWTPPAGVNASVHYCDACSDERRAVAKATFEADGKVSVQVGGYALRVPAASQLKLDDGDVAVDALHEFEEAPCAACKGTGWVPAEKGDLQSNPTIVPGVEEPCLWCKLRPGEVRILSEPEFVGKFPVRTELSLRGPDDERRAPVVREIRPVRRQIYEQRVERWTQETLVVDGLPAPETPVLAVHETVGIAVVNRRAMRALMGVKRVVVHRFDD